MNEQPRKLKILECTLRDGSYAINFQFTASDTMLICTALEKAGFDMIEIGHGVGLNASRTGHGEAAETDEAYLRAAQSSLKKAKFGMFCIPGIARLEDIDMAAEHGMAFIRIGTNVTEVERSQKYIERAKKTGHARGRQLHEVLCPRARPSRGKSQTLKKLWGGFYLHR